MTMSLFTPVRNLRTLMRWFWSNECVTDGSRIEMTMLISIVAQRFRFQMPAVKLLEGQGSLKLSDALL